MEFWTNIAALVTAIATLATVLEMRSQRLSSFKPDLLLVGSKIDFVSDTATSSLTARSAIECINGGLAGAKYIRFNWSCNFHECISVIGQIDGPTSEGIIVEGEFLQIKTQAIECYHNLVPQMNSSIAYLSANSKAEVNVPSVYLHLFNVYWRCVATAASGNLDFPEFPSLDVDIDYVDLADGGHTKLFTLSARLISM